MADQYKEIVRVMTGMADSIRHELGDYRLKGTSVRSARWVENPVCPLRETR